MPNLSTIILNAIKTTDGVYGEKYHYSSQYYIAHQGHCQLYPVAFVAKDGKSQIMIDEGRKRVAWRFIEKPLDEWYEYSTDYHLVEDLCKCLRI